MKILLVDDNQEDAFLLNRALRRSGYEVETAPNGAEALKKVFQNGFNIIISDILMPCMDGFQFCRKVKTDEKLKNIPFIFYTGAYTGPQDEEFALRLGAEKIILKSPEPEEHIKILKEVITNYETEKYTAPAQLPEEESVYLKQYNTRLVIQVEKKLQELGETNRELIQKEKESSQSREHYLQLFEGLNDGVYVFKPGGRFFAVNKKASEQTGYSRKTLLTKKLADLTSPEFASLDQTKAKKAFRDGEMLWESQHLNKMGGTTPVEINARRISYFGSTAILLIIRDITERKKAQKLLASEKERLAMTLRSKEQLAETLHSIGDAVIITDRDGKILSFNKTAEELTGRTQQKAEGKSLDEVFHTKNEETGEWCEIPAKKVAAAGRAANLADHTLLTAKDGTERIIAGNLASISDKEGNNIGLVMVCRDITKKQRKEEELLKTSKLESVGLLAGGIAHEFNNILTAVIGNLSLAKMLISPEDDLFKTLNEAEKASLQAKFLTNKLLTFSKGGAPIKKIASIAELIKNAAEFSLKGSRLKCAFSLADDLWPVEIDEGQISQVINNLIINADQAMPQGGTIRVQAQNMSLKEERIVHGSVLLKGNYIEISVKDQGGGIPKEHLQKIFDPFFTTKDIGSGLGLTASYSIVKNHGGRLAVESELGVGTTFYIYLPCVATEKLISPKEIPVIEEFKEISFVGRGRVLIMDDQEGVRKILGDLLPLLGYEVDQAPDGAEAVELYRKALKFNRPFDAVIMDLIIPGGMGGDEAIKKLIEIDPGVKAIVTSGYSSDPIMVDFRQYGFKACLTKPYDPQILGKTLLEVIEKKENSDDRQKKFSD